MTSAADPPAATPAASPPPRRAAFSQEKLGFLLTLASTAGVLVIGMANGMITARLLGVTGRGELAAIQNPISFLSYVALASLNSSVGYYGVKEPGETRPLAVTAMGLFLLLALPLMAAGYLVLPSILQGDAAKLVPTTRLYLLMVVAQAPALIMMSGLQGMGRFGLVGVLRLFPGAISIAVLLIARATHQAQAIIVSRYYLTGYLLVPLACFFMWQRVSSGPWHFRRRWVGPIIRYALPTALLVPVGSLNLQLDQLIMAGVMPSAQLGLYVVSVSWSSLTGPAFSSLGIVLFPTLAAMNNPENQRAIVGRSMRLGVLLALILFVGQLILTPLCLPLLFGKAFAPALPTAFVLVAAGVMLNLGGLSAEILRGLGHSRWPLYGQLAALPVTALTLWLLLPRWGILGAGVASLLAYSVGLFVGLAGIKQTCQLRVADLVPGRADLHELVGHGLSLWARVRKPRTA